MKRLIEGLQLTVAVAIVVLFLIAIGTAIVMALSGVFVCFEHAIHLLEVLWPN